MIRKIVLQVKPEENESRLDLFLSRRLERFSRNEIQKRIDAGQVSCEGRTAKASRRVVTGESISLVFEVPDIPEDQWEPNPPVILYEDERVLAVDKTPDIPVHPTGGFGDKSTLTVLQRYYPKQYFAPAHRLDRETSGVLLFAKDVEADQKLKRAFFERRCKKEYAALVVGVIEQSEFEISLSIGPADDGLKNRWAPKSIEAGGYKANTRVAVQRRFAAHTRVALFPETGKQHQLRVHLSAVGHYIVGDKLYGPSQDLYREFAQNRGMTPNLWKVLQIGRQALHAKTLTFPHPKTGAEISVESPWPQDLEAFEKSIE